MKSLKALKNMMNKDSKYHEYISLAFYDLDNELLLSQFGGWTKQKQEELEKAKVNINALKDDIFNIE